jgi:hypothetical protein
MPGLRVSAGFSFIFYERVWLIYTIYNFLQLKYKLGSVVMYLIIWPVTEYISDAIANEKVPPVCFPV